MINKEELIKALQEAQEKNRIGDMVHGVRRNIALRHLFEKKTGEEATFCMPDPPKNLCAHKDEYVNFLEEIIEQICLNKDNSHG